MSFPLPLLKVETCGFLFWEGFQPIIRLAFQNSSMLLICMGMRYVSIFAMSFIPNTLTRGFKWASLRHVLLITEVCHNPRKTKYVCIYWGIFRIKFPCFGGRALGDLTSMVKSSTILHSRPLLSRELCLLQVSKARGFRFPGNELDAVVCLYIVIA